MEEWAGVILAAGKGVRFKSKVPKPLHPVCGRPLVTYPVELMRSVGIQHVLVVVSPQNESMVKSLLGDTVQYIQQEQPLGTGHALLQAATALQGQASNLVVSGCDSPLLKPPTIRSLMSFHQTRDLHVALLTSDKCMQRGLGKVLRDKVGRVVAIVEASELKNGEKDTSEVNSGAYCFQAAWLWGNLNNIPMAPEGEFYLTSLVATASAAGYAIDALMTDDPTEVLGVNDRLELAQVESIMRQRIREHWMREGVTILDPPSTFIDADVQLGQDTVIYPNTMILGRSRIGGNCTIGPNSIIRDSQIGDDCQVVASVIEESVLEPRADVGPFSHLRPGSYLANDVHVGNFAEIKNSRLGKGVKMGHFGYLGDASVGENANLGAGMVTCNYDGVNKHRTTIGEGAFIGCDTMLVAPVTVGAQAYTGAGAVVTKDVPPNTLAVGVPARAIKKRDQGLGVRDQEEKTEA